MNNFCICKLKVYGSYEKVKNFFDDFYNEGIKSFAMKSMLLHCNVELFNKFVENKYSDIYTGDIYQSVIDSYNNKCMTYSFLILDNPNFPFFTYVSKQYKSLKFEVFAVNTDLKFYDYMLVENGRKLDNLYISADNKTSTINLFDRSIDVGLMSLEDVLIYFDNNDKYDLLSYYEDRYLDSEDVDIKIDIN